MKSPLVVLVTITSLSLGIGASTSVFTIINAFFFQESQGLRDPEGLVAIYTSADHGGLYGESSFPDYLTLHEESETLQDLVAFRAGFLTFDSPSDAPEAPADRLIVEIVTGNYFDVMGIRLPLGRGFSPEETELGRAENLIVLSHEAWMDRFGGDPGILGKALHLDNREFTVIGVGPPGLVSRLLRLKVSGWVPFGTPTGIWHATPEELASRRDHDCNIMARLKEGTPIDAVRSELGLIATRLKPKEMPKAKVDPDLCTGCVFCVDVCPYNALSMVDYDSVPGVNMVAVVDQDACMGCDHLCTSVCIKDAIELHMLAPPKKDAPKEAKQPVGS